MKYALRKNGLPQQARKSILLSNDPSVGRNRHNSAMSNELCKMRNEGLLTFEKSQFTLLQ